MESIEGPHPDPFGHALSGAGQKAAELVSVAAMLAQAAAQARARKDGLAAARDEADLAAARAAWAPVLDPGWRADAGLADVARAWGAAIPWEQAEAGAADALDAAEARLRELHPAAMRGFDRRRAAGTPRADAMLATVGDFVLDPAGSAGRPRACPRRRRAS